MPVEVLMNQGVQSYGMSITMGSAAVNTVNYWVNRLATYIGGPVDNRAVSGTGFQSMVLQANMNMPYGNRTKLIVIDGPLNDIRVAGPAVLPSVKFALDAMISSAFSGYVRGAAWNDTNVIRSGTWASLGNSYGGRSCFFGLNPMYTNDPAASITFKFSGPIVAFHGFASETDDWLDMDIEIDGVSCGTTDFAFSARPGYGKQCGAMVFDNLDAGLHTLKVSPPATGIPSGHSCVVDCVQSPYNPLAPVIVGTVPDIKDWTAFGSIGTFADAQQVNIIIKQVVTEWKARGYPVACADLTEFVEKDRDYSPDGVHPLDRGQLNWALGYLSQVRIKP